MQAVVLRSYVRLTAYPRTSRWPAGPPCSAGEDRIRTAEEKVPDASGRSDAAWKSRHSRSRCISLDDPCQRPALFLDLIRQIMNAIHETDWDVVEKAMMTLSAMSENPEMRNILNSLKLGTSLSSF